MFTPPIDFAHLHVHIEYSLLDGLHHIKPLAKEAKALNSLFFLRG